MRLAAVLLALSVPAYADAVVVDVCEPQADTCVYSIDSGPEKTMAVATSLAYGIPSCGNRVCLVNIDDLPAGSHTIRMKPRVSAFGPRYDAPFIERAFEKPAGPLRGFDEPRIVQ